MTIEKLKLPGVKIFTPDVYKDERGYFSETFNPHYDFKPYQASMSFSKKGVIRGMHYLAGGVEKLVWVARGSIFDVVLNRETGQWVGEVLSAENHKQLLCPRQYAHGFQALEDGTVVCYLQDIPHNPFGDLGYSPLTAGIDWPLKDYIVSDKDKNAPSIHSKPSSD